MLFIESQPTIVWQSISDCQEAAVLDTQRTTASVIADARGETQTMIYFDVGRLLLQSGDADLEACSERACSTQYGTPPAVQAAQARCLSAYGAEVEPPAWEVQLQREVDHHSHDIPRHKHVASRYGGGLMELPDLACRQSSPSTTSQRCRSETPQVASRCRGSLWPCVPLTMSLDNSSLIALQGSFQV